MGDFPVERRFSFPYPGFSDFAMGAWEKVTGVHTNHPTRALKDAADWARETGRAAASYPTEAAAQEEAWAEWEWRKHGAPGGAWRHVSDRQRWRFPKLRIMDSLPQLMHCLERIVEQNAVFVRVHDLQRYAQHAEAALGLVHHARKVARSAGAR